MRRCGASTSRPEKRRRSVASSRRWSSARWCRPTENGSRIRATRPAPNRVYVQPFPPTGAKYQVYAKDSDGGHHVLWSPDSKELFYNPRPGSYEVVRVTTQPTVAFGNPTNVPRPFQTGPPQVRRPFDMMPNGKFVALATPGQTSSGGNTQPDGNPCGAELVRGAEAARPGEIGAVLRNRSATYFVPRPEAG